MEKPWRRAIDGVNTLATNHSVFATKLTQELINPLSQYDRTPENGNMGMLERNLTQISKDLEMAESKVSKAGSSKSKNKSSKQTEAQDELRKARSRWDSESPNSFEKLQQVDEARIVFLRDALVKFETSSIDLYSSQIKASETAIAQLLEVNPTDEPMDFVSKKFAQGSDIQSLPRPAAPGLSRTVSQGDSGSVRSSGGAASTLKSKFGTLLKGRNSGASNKRMSMLQSSTNSNNSNAGGSSGNNYNTAVSRQTLSEMAEEPEPAPPVTRSNPFSTDDNVGTRDVTPTPVAAVSVSSAQAVPEENSIFTTASQSRNAETIQRTGAFGNEPSAQIYSEPTTGLQNSLRGVNIRSDSFANTSKDEDEAAMDRVSNTLRSQPTVSRRSRGRRDVRSAMFSPIQDESAQNVARDVLGSPLPQASEPLFPTQAPPATNSMPVNIYQNRASVIERQDTGAESIRSTRSNHSAAQGSRHAEPTTDGFHLSVIETVSVVLGTEGSVTNFSVAGEAAVANRNPTDHLPLQVRIQSPDMIDRLVANTQILRSVEELTYELSATAVPNMTTLFKYQVQPDQGRRTRFMPILLSQKWSTEANQTSVKLSYRLNPLFGAGSLTLQDVEVSVSVNGAATSCVAKPAGSFVKRSNKLVWRLNELTLEGGKEGTLLARFKTASTCPPSDSTELKFRTTPSNIGRGSGFGLYATRSRDNPFADAPTIENVMMQNMYVLQSGRVTASTTAP